jgi:glycosyltransferase involved in cell wall biosynthesis
VVLLQTTIPDYRVPAVAGLRHRLGQRLVVVTGQSDFSEGVHLAPGISDVDVVENVFLLGRRLLWQRKCVHRLSRSPTLILELNPRVMSSWLLLVRRRLAGRRSILYGHAWPRRGSGARTDRVRALMRRLGNAVIVYTDSQAKELATRMPGTVVRAAPNALYSRTLAVEGADRRSARNIICVGRLVAAKKPLLLLEGFSRAMPMLPGDTRLVFVGDGPLSAALEERAQHLGVAGRVDLVGHVDAFERLRGLYADALVSVSPGYVGLSLTQSLWFGVPALIARDEPHAPEIEAAKPGMNAVFFDSDEPEALGKALVDAFERRDLWLERAPAIAEACVRRYSLESMVDAIVEVVDAG